MVDIAGAQSHTPISGSGAPVDRIHRAFTQRENTDRLTQAIGSQIWVTDLDGRFVRANGPWLTAHGFESIKDVLGKTTHDLLEPARAAMSVSEDLRVTDSGENSVSVFTDDEGRAFQSIRMPLFDSGEMIGLVGVITPQQAIADPAVNVVSQDDIDQLTGASSLAALHTYLTEVVASHDPMSVLLIDLDDFRVVNNSLGREVGDRLLQKAASRLITVFGSRLFRVSGDAFVVVLPTTERAQLDVVTEQILQRWTRPLIVDGTEIYGGVSIGIAPINGQASSTQVLQDAEMALRKAKDGGRNRAIVFDPVQQSLADEELWRQMLVRRAVADKEFSLYWQPIVEIESGTVVGVEALLRWQPAGGETARPAAEFVPFLEHSGLVIPIGRQVIDDACRQHMSWRTQNKIGRPISIFVNVSRRQFTSDALADDVLSTLQNHGVDPKNLTLEVADLSAGTDIEKVVNDIARLGRAGVRVAVDDFGVANSTLADLANLPIQIAKVSRSITGRIEEGKNDPMLDSIQHITRSVGVQTIAQGVENDMQLEWLRSRGWTHVQGYHISKPMSPEAMTDYLAEHFARPEGQRWGN